MVTTAVVGGAPNGCLLARSNCLENLWRLLLISAEIQTTHISLKMDTVLCMKYLMFFFCVLVFIGSLCLIIVAIWAIIDPKRILDIHPNYFLKIAASIILLMGLLLSWLSYLGIYATVAEDVKLLKNLVIVVLVISIVKLLVTILLYFFAAKIRDKYLVNQLAKKYEGDDGTNVYSKALNGFMIMFQCCGILGSRDFQDAEFFKEKQPRDSWPQACCTRGKSPEPEEILDVKLCQEGKDGYVNNLGCSQVIAYFFSWYTWTFVGCCLGVLAAEIFVMATAWYLHRKLDD
ncbi:tetraspanin-18-like isoform X2 [Pantherophis guttatus]|uniref:Tetraspanin n=1 Tax=Pantherophis guttatus TaxID=94885 RepID=A0A6P9BJ04_PANGU|nr:tetraspanin-18-like isoform X2 [Pantherophis guttatus]